ncbi:fibroblast growth factor receptor-like [Brachionus plicatilis]|uniref:Fibroblast growth factor receptor-like n=1 Tax=Brachionus plicatilis TaxID=10195 RepID=A0A3M7RQA8_BRAPC|nr:fibroblast growth factor receptor-like [Brachionus plicatilis]
MGVWNNLGFNMEIKLFEDGFEYDWFTMKYGEMISFEERRGVFVNRILNRVKAKIVYGDEEFGFFQVEFDVISPDARCWGRYNRFIVDIYGIYCGYNEGYYVKAHEWTHIPKKESIPIHKPSDYDSNVQVPDRKLLIKNKSSEYGKWLTEQEKKLIKWKDNWAHACDFEGENIKFESLKGEECGGRCAQTASCTHFTWTSFNGGTCWMKSKNGIAKSDAFYTYDKSMVCGVVRSEADAKIDWKGNWALACDFKDNDLKNEKSTGEECGGRCAQTASCTHFTWTSFNGGTCWMKSKNGIAKSDAIFTGDESMFLKIRCIKINIKN